MKHKLNEEEYNEIIKLGVCNDEQQASEIVYRLQDEGIESYNENNIIFISIEQDRNNPHYVDDVKNYAMSIFNDCCKSTNQQMKLACSKRKTMKLTESKLKNLIKESVRKALLEL